MAFPVLEHSDLNRVAEVSSDTEQRCCLWWLWEVGQASRMTEAFADHHASLRP